MLLLAVELFLMPTLLGIGLDICSLSLFAGSSLASRLASLVRMPALWLFVHWLVGLFFVLVLSFLLTQLEALLEPTLFHRPAACVNAVWVTLPTRAAPAAPPS